MVDRPEVAKLAERMGMEGPSGDARQAERAKTLHHLAGSLVRERHDQGLVGRHDTRGNRERRAPADHPRLPGPGPGDDGDGAIDGADRLELGLVQVVEKSRRRGKGGHRPRLAAGAYPGLHRTSVAAPPLLTFAPEHGE